MDNYPPELKNQETLYDQNKMGRLNLLSEQDVHAMFTTEKVRECSKTVCKFCYYLSRSYLKQRGNHYLYPRHFSFSVIFGKTVIIGTKCEKF